MVASRLILASASPRRRELLEQLGVAYDCQPADIDESQRSGEPPRDYVARMAREKAAVVARQVGQSASAVLAADTSVVLAGEVLGKPSDYAQGLAMLQGLSGHQHSVLTAVTLRIGEAEHSLLVETLVQFEHLSLATCEAYLATGEAWDKAGAYGIQGLAGAFVTGIEGSYSNVVGLPLAQTRQLLLAHGIDTGLERSHD